MKFRNSLTDGKEISVIKTTTTIIISVKLHLNILSSPQIANATLGGPVHQDQIKNFINTIK